MRETIREEFAYALAELPYNLRKNKYYSGLFFVTMRGVRVYIDCNHSEPCDYVEIPKITNYEGAGLEKEVFGLRRELAKRISKYLVKNKASVKPKIITYEELVEMGLIDELKKKHQEAKPGRDLWKYEEERGVARIFKVVGSRTVDVNISGRDQKSLMFDIVDMETREELCVWGCGRLLNAFKIDGVYVVEYNGKSDKGHSFWITDVTKEYNEGVKKQHKK